THLFMVSEWSARCHRGSNPTGCVNAVENPLAPPHEPQNPTNRKPDYAWTDLTYLLHKHHVPWRYYVFTGTQPDCSEDEMICGAVDHQVLSFDAYAKFVEDDFLGGARLDPTTDGRPDPRPTVRENVPVLGNLAADFDFSQKPRKPLLLPLRPPFR